MHTNCIQLKSICFFFIDYQNLCCSADTSGLHTQITLRASGLNETVLSPLSWQRPQIPLFPLPEHWQLESVAVDGIDSI